MKTIAFFSYNEGVEKITVAAANALSLENKNVYIIDLNFHSPTLGSIISDDHEDIIPKRGLVDLILDYIKNDSKEITKEDILHYSTPTSIENVHCIYVGNPGTLGKFNLDYWNNIKGRFNYFKKGVDKRGTLWSGIKKGIEELNVDYLLINCPGQLKASSGTEFEIISKKLIINTTEEKWNICGNNQILMSFDKFRCEGPLPEEPSYEETETSVLDIKIITASKKPEYIENLLNKGLKNPYKVHTFDLSNQHSILKAIAPELISKK